RRDGVFLQPAGAVERAASETVPGVRGLLPPGSRGAGESVGVNAACGLARAGPAASGYYCGADPTRAGPASLVETSCWPVLSKATVSTRPSWPLSVRVVSFVSRSQMRMVQSSLPEARRLPSGLNVTLLT